MLLLNFLTATQLLYLYCYSPNSGIVLYLCQQVTSAKNWGENYGCWAYTGTVQFFEYPLLSQERIKLQTSNLADVSRGSMRTKAN